MGVPLLSEFKDFLTKSNALALAIGVIIGAATGKVVSALVDDVLMPPVGMVMPKGDWRDAQIVLSQGTDAEGKQTVNAVKYGHFVGAIFDFIVISFVVFILTKTLLPKDPPPASTKTCPECLEAIPESARRCRACTASLV
jgi:large conductance mechanosensitive channel